MIGRVRKFVREPALSAVAFMIQPLLLGSIICRCSTTGPSASAGTKVSAPTNKTTPTSIVMNSGVWVGSVPAVSRGGALRRQAAGDREHRE